MPLSAVATIAHALNLPEFQLLVSPADPSLSHLRVLIVDDNKDNALTLQWAVEGLGCRVVSCHDGMTALQVANDFVPDVALLDLGLPGMDGLQLGRALRANPALRHLKIVAQTGWGDQAMRQRTAENGFDLHLVKPINLSVLEDLLHLVGSAMPASRMVADRLG